MANDVDISENFLLETHPMVLEKLLKDHTTQKNIFWATDSYADKGEGYQFNDEIKVVHITGENGRIIQPRSVKNQHIQNQRIKDMAEVFTPSWVCNAQNNLIDEAWFGFKNVFNTEDSANHTWKPNLNFIQFPNGKSWQDYVKELRLEITCGEGPYLISRYDTVTGLPITDLHMRVGILDRKLRVVSENTETSGEWLKWAKEALKSTYGFEWQGDSLLLAREAMFYTFCDYYESKFAKQVPEVSLPGIADIISWNLWQMDGIKMVIPESCNNQYITDLFGDEHKIECPACKNGDTFGHIGIKCRIRDWRYSGKNEDLQKPYFTSLLNEKS